jgi:integrase
VKNIRGSIEGLRVRAGIAEKLHPHDFRRSYERLARRAGIDDATSRAIMGHSQGSDAHAVYVKVTIEDLVEAGKKIQPGLLERLLEIPDVT